MWAQVLTEAARVEGSPLRWRELPDSIPGEGEVRLRVRACGVCHTDLHLAQGDLPLHRSPLVPGHQIVGEIDAVGPHCRAAVGQRVGVTWLARTCGSCEFCEDGRENLCSAARFTGWDVDGGFAESVIVREDYAHPLAPDQDALTLAPLLCAGVIGLRSLRLCGVEPGQRLGLFGFGASAHIALQIARHWGCQVYVFSRGNDHRRHAEELGATWTGMPGADPPRRLHGAVTFAPSGQVVYDALGALERGGTLAVNAVHCSPIPTLPYERLYHERTLRSVANCTRKDARDLIALAERGVLQTTVEEFPLREANAALLALHEARVRGAAVLRA